MMPEDTLLRKIFSIIRGIVVGFWFGGLVGITIALLYFDAIAKINVSGEKGFAVALWGGIFGIPLGIIGSITLSYLKRNSRPWRIFFWLATIYIIFKFLFGGTVSLLGEAGILYKSLGGEI